MERTYRPATLIDLPVIVSIYNATIASRQVTGDLEPVSVTSRMDWFAAHHPASRPLWVAEQAGQVVAWLSFSDFYGRPAYLHTAELSLYVDQSVQRCGWGSYLLSEAIAYAPKLNIHRLLAFIFGHNGPSLSLFQKYAFEKWGVLPGVACMDQVERDLFILGRSVVP